jgi:hypothetical protein
LALGLEKRKRKISKRKRKEKENNPLEAVAFGRRKTRCKQKM